MKPIAFERVEPPLIEFEGVTRVFGSGRSCVQPRSADPMLNAKPSTVTAMQAAAST